MQATAVRSKTRTGIFAGSVVACGLISLFCVLTPLAVMNPFRSQGSREFAFAMAVLKAGPIISALCALVAILAMIRAWPGATRTRSRVGLGLCLFLAVAGAGLTRINVFEILFHPYLSPGFGSADSVSLDKDEMVMSLTVRDDTHAYLIGAMGYHHIVNDIVGGVPVAATYCTLCHTGIIWKRAIDGLILTFRLAGIRDGNALLRDEETNSVWQQSTGVAIYGPLKGKQLDPMHSDELTFALWRSEQPQGLILKPNARDASNYGDKFWEKSAEKYPSVIDTSKTGIQPRELMLGIATSTASKAFPWNAVLSAKLIQDRVGGEPVLLIVGPDNLSFRAFVTQANAIFLRSGSDANRFMTDAETSSVWNFSGCAVSGPLTGQCLQPVDAVKDYWFDWFNYHPATAVFR